MKASNWLQDVLTYEQAGMTRAAIMALVQDELKAIDTERKAIREQLREKVKALSAVDGCKVTNLLCKASHGATNAESKRLQRRRDMLVSLMRQCHPEYDFIKDAGLVSCEFIGSAQVREANVLLASLAKLTALGFTMPTIERSDIVEAIGEADGQDAGEAILVPQTEEMQRHLLSIAGKLGSMQAVVDQVKAGQTAGQAAAEKSEGETKKVKQA